MANAMKGIGWLASTLLVLLAIVEIVDQIRGIDEPNVYLPILFVVGGAAALLLGHVFALLASRVSICEPQREEESSLGAYGEGEGGRVAVRPGAARSGGDHAS